MKILIATIAAALLLGLALWRPWESQAPLPDSSPAPVVAKSPPPLPLVDDEPAVTSLPEPSPPTPAPDLSSLTSEELQRIRDAIDSVELVLRDYAVALDGNPVGTNAEITASLLGDNPKQLRLDLPAGSSVNDIGELCDPWGTPWFFHQISAKKMELRSAGPDQKLYTDDDFVR